MPELVFDLSREIEVFHCEASHMNIHFLVHGRELPSAHRRRATEISELELCLNLLVYQPSTPDFCVNVAFSTLADLTREYEHSHTRCDSDLPPILLLRQHLRACHRANDSSSPGEILASRARQLYY